MVPCISASSKPCSYQLMQLIPYRRDLWLNAYEPHVCDSGKKPLWRVG